MESLRTVAPTSLIGSYHLFKPIFNLSFTQKTFKSLTKFPKSKFTKFTAISPSVSTEPEKETRSYDQDENFDWFSHWYALMPVCDLDKRAPRGMKVLGLDVVVWWDKNLNTWKVFEDRCPHRLAPLSEGRIDQWGRLQCVYHGWCFDGSGDCKLIPQAPLDGPPVHTLPKACVAVYPSTVQNGIVWFWPNTDSQYKDIITKKKPPYIPELDDPSYLVQMFTRDIPYGYEVLVENLMDPSHVPYTHLGLMSIAPQPSVKVDREGGSPIDIKIQKVDKNGFTATEQGRQWNFVSPCLVQGSLTIKESPNSTQGKLAQKPPQKQLFILFCIPVSPGNSRLINVSPRNFSLWIDPFVSRWMHHIAQNLVIDSDLYLIRVQEEKLMKAGPSNWHKSCFVPTKADTMVALFRTWLKKYTGGQVDWRTNGSLPPIPPREQLIDRYWSHVVNCSTCNGAYKGLNALQKSLQVCSVAMLAIMAATKQGMISVATRNTLAVAAILCFVGSKWLSRFIYKNFHFHDYNHAFK
ncbi:protochlorophyllide-dependent translocon component 52, chloroplastic-like [Bidens hawaiensis]|uniref:protochlorophyllide-dependent translocon component 52, chloroplastic-like n=1 Tax=Bidens hawaiensis TaxID=980011 RepID=UPI00404BA2B1